MMTGGCGQALELWGGVECTVNRVGDQFRDQVVMSGHETREDDLERFASLGLRTLRFPVLWERTAPDGVAHADWRWPDRRLNRARALGIRPIVGLVHHGSGPASTHLLDPAFPARLSAYARAVAERYPWVTAYTPVNEPLTTARFSALYGHWYPHSRDDGEFARALIGQCRATVLAMQTIREVNPEAVLVQTEDIGRTYSTPLLAYQAAFDNDRRWLSFDLLTGRLSPTDRMWRYLRDVGIPVSDLEWFRETPCPPGMLGINHYLTSNRFLDTDLDRYPPDSWGGNGRHRYADVAAARVLDAPPDPGEVIAETWERYHLPLAVTEAHLGCSREEQLRWLVEVWEAADAQRQRGVDVRAVTAWALLGSYDWDSLLTEDAHHYEPGAFDVRGPAPRLTAIGRMIREITSGRAPAHPTLEGKGWWRRHIRLSYGHHLRVSRPNPLPNTAGPRPLVVVGARGTLGTAFGRLAELRGLDTLLLSRADLDISDPEAVRSVLTSLRPWALVNAAGFVKVDEAERQVTACFRGNADGPATLAGACAGLGIELVTFSTDLVFGGQQRRPYVESDPTGPLNVYGASKAEAERRVAGLMPSALIIRTSAFFGPWDDYNLLTRALRALREGQEWHAPHGVVSPTYVPDLVNAALDLLIDGERGVWHLANPGAVSWLDFVRRGAEQAGIDPTRARASSVPQQGAARPPYSVLGSERGTLLPPLEDALLRYRDAMMAQPARARSLEASAGNPAAGA